MTAFPLLQKVCSINVYIVREVLTVKLEKMSYEKETVNQLIPR